MKTTTTNGSNGPAFPPVPLPDLGTIREAADFLAARDAAGKDSPPSCDLEDFNGLPTTPPGLAGMLEAASRAFEADWRTIRGSVCDPGRVSPVRRLRTKIGDFIVRAWSPDAAYVGIPAGRYDAEALAGAGDPRAAELGDVRPVTIRGHAYGSGSGLYGVLRRDLPGGEWRIGREATPTCPAARQWDPERGYLGGDFDGMTPAARKTLAAAVMPAWAEFVASEDGRAFLALAGVVHLRDEVARRASHYREKLAACLKAAGELRDALAAEALAVRS